MKKNILSVSILLLILIRIIQPNILLADEKEKRTNCTINFYNLTDYPPALPFMSILFNQLPESKVKEVTAWREEIDEKLQKLGGIVGEADYKKIDGVIQEYAQKFISTGAKAIAIEFPRQKRGIPLSKENPKKSPVQ